MIAARTGIPPSVLWREEPEDLVALIDALGRIR